jgi:hypothetical protein
MCHGLQGVVCSFLPGRHCGTLGSEIRWYIPLLWASADPHDPTHHPRRVPILSPRRCQYRSASIQEQRATLAGPGCCVALASHAYYYRAAGRSWPRPNLNVLQLCSALLHALILHLLSLRALPCRLPTPAPNQARPAVLAMNMCIRRDSIGQVAALGSEGWHSPMLRVEIIISETFLHLLPENQRPLVRSRSHVPRSWPSPIVCLWGGQWLARPGS